MDVVLVITLAVALGAVAWLIVNRPAAPAQPPAPLVAPVIEVPRELVEHAVALAVAQANERASRERDLAVQAAVEQSATFNRQQLGSQTAASEATLDGKHQLIDQRLGEVQAGVHADIQRLTQLVQQMGDATSQRFGEVDRSLQAHVEITQTLAHTTGSLREALASSNARGQWGERMAEDIIRAAGLLEHTQYAKRTAVDGAGTGIPDFTFFLPKGHVLFMDVKFPMAAYLKYLDADTDAERSAHRATFLRDVRSRVRELAKREYAQEDDRPAVDNVLLFVPNETLSAFIHENDPQLIDEAMRQNVVICSPLTLFAYLGIIRQAFDNFVLEQASHEILGLLGKFGQQWAKYTDSVDKVRRQFDSVAKSFDELATTRRRALERPLNAIDDIRRRSSLPIDGQLFSVPPADDDTDGFESYTNVRELGA